MWPWSSSTGTVSCEVSRALQPQHVGDRLVRRQELAELADAAVVAEGLLVRAVLAGRARQAALVAHDEGQPGHQEGGLPGPLAQLVVGEARRP